LIGTEQYFSGGLDSSSWREAGNERARDRQIQRESKIEGGVMRSAKCEGGGLRAECVQQRVLYTGTHLLLIDIRGSDCLICENWFFSTFPRKVAVE
jgi:hypothetical protein